MAGVLAAFAVAFAVMTGQALADEYEPLVPPMNHTLGVGGLDLGTFEYSYQNEDISVGSDSPAQLSLVRSFSTAPYANSLRAPFGGGTTHNLDGYMSGCGNTESKDVVVVLLGRTYRFIQSGSQGSVPLHADADGSGHAVNCLTGEFRTADGVVARSDPYQNASCGRRCRSFTDVTFPNGEFLKFEYDYGYYSSGGIGYPAPSMNRLLRVYNSRGYGIKLKYMNESANIGIADRRRFTIVEAEAYRVSCTNGVVNCALGSLAKATYSYTSVPGSLSNLGVTDNDPAKSAGRVLTGYTDPSGKTTTYAHSLDASYQPTFSITYPGETTPRVTSVFSRADTAYGYGRKFTQTDASGNLFSAWRAQLAPFVPYVCGAVTLPDGYCETTFLTDAEGRQSTYYTFTVAYNNQSEFEVQRLSTVEDSLGGISTFIYDNKLRLVETKDSEGARVLLTLDDRGNVTEARRKPRTGFSAADHVVTAAFPACTATNQRICNQPSYRIDANGARTDYVYDPAHGGLAMLITPPDASGKRAVTRRDYGLFDPAPGVALPAGTATPVAALMTTEDRCLSSTVTSVVPGAGDLAFVCPTADRVRTSYAYTASTSGAPKTYELEAVTIDPGGLALTTSYTYDMVGNIVGQDGPKAGSTDTTLTSYDAQRRPTLVTSPTVGGVTAKTSWVYDDAGRISQKRQSNGSAWLTETTTYDARGYVASVTGIDGVVETYSYYKDGALKDTSRTVDGVPRVVRNIYDGAGRLAQVRRAVGTPLEQAYATWTYSSAGDRLSEQDAKGNLVTACYDGFRRRTELRFPSGTVAPASAPTCAAIPAGGTLPGGVTREIYAYDARGNMTSLIRRGGATIGMSYDARGLLTLRDVPEANRDVSYAYDLLGRRTGAALPGANAIYSVAWTFDKADRVVTETSNGRTMTHAYDPSGAWVELQWPDMLKVRGSVDALGRVTALDEVGGPTLVGYSYDELSRRTSISRGNGRGSTYSYNAQQRLGGISHALTGGAVSFGFTYNEASQIKSRSIDNPAYTWSGGASSRAYTANALNQYTASGGLTLTYDASGNLTGDGLSAYGYDSENRLVSVGGATSQLTYDAVGRLARIASNGVTTQFLYDDMRLVAEYSGTGALLRRHVHGANVDEPVVTMEGGARTWLYAENQGSIIALGNASGGVVGTAAYDEYGIEQTNLGRFGYTGQTRLPEIGLYYYKARMYSPTLGRFLQTDPVGTEDNLNLYAYVGNDPMNASDPSGQSCFPSCQWNEEEAARDKGSTLDRIVGTVNGFFNEIAAGFSTPKVEVRGNLPVPDNAEGRAGARTGGLLGAVASVAEPTPSGEGRLLSRGVARVLKRTCCFAAGTLISTDKGLRPIEAIQVGDRVLSRDEETGETAYKPVTALVRRPQRQILELKVALIPSEGGAVRHEVFRTTDDHPWRVASGSWARTDELKPGDLIVTSSSQAEVISIEDTGVEEPVFNLEVADFHTYFVGEDQLWVHNECLRLLQELAMEEARDNPAAVRIMQGLIKDPRYPEKTFGKFEYVHRTKDGRNITVHFWRNLDTGAEFGFKIK